MILANNAIAEALFHVDELLDFAFQHAGDGDASPLADDFGDVFFVDFFLQHACRRFTRSSILHGVELLQLGFELRQIAVLDLRSALKLALAGLLFGFDTAVISGTTNALTQTYQLSPAMLGVTVSSALLGTVVGAITAGIPGQKFGRRDSLRVMAIFYVISALGCAFAWNWTALIVFRFIGGLGIGGSSVLGPMYIAEIAPAEWRGRST